MLGNFIGNAICRQSGGGYWTQQLDLWYKTISGDAFIDSINALNGKILPICNKFTAASLDVGDYTIANYLSAAGSGTITAFVKVGTNTIYFFSSTDKASGTAYCNFFIDNNRKININVRAATNNVMVSTNAVSPGWHKIECSSTGAAYGMKLDDASVTFGVTAGANNGNWFSYVANRDSISIGATLDSSPIYGNESIAWVQVDGGTNGYWICDNKNYIYDISGKGYHMTLSGTGRRITGDSGAPNYKLTNGYTLYGKAGAINIQVPRLLAGTKIISPTLPAGYVEILDVAGIVTGHNHSDFIMDFDPTDSLDSRLAVFDKSNTTIHVATTSMNYYNSTSVYEWRLLELYDPRIYFDYFNVGYRGMIYSKIGSIEVLGVIYPISYTEQLIYSVDKTGIKEWGIMKHCGIDVFADKDVDGNPVYDVNDYVVIL
jgi:hypothetical protein